MIPASIREFHQNIVRTGSGEIRRAFAAPWFASAPSAMMAGPCSRSSDISAPIPKVERRILRSRLFWIRARYRLGLLRLPPNEIKLIERSLAERVPPPEQQQAAE